MSNKNILLFGLGLLFVGLTFFYVETINYKKSELLPANFEINYETYLLDTNIGDTVYVRKYNQQKAVYVTDNSLPDNTFKIVVEHPSSSNVKYQVSRTDKNDGFGEKIDVSIINDINYSKKEITNILNLGVRTINDKVKYNYALIKYGNVYVYANESYINNIMFVNYGFIED